MNSLFDFASEPLFLGLPDAEIIYYPEFYDKPAADLMYTELVKDILWQQDEIRVFGKIHPQPRLTALYGNEGKSYSYSNIKMQPHPWNLLLQKIKSEVEKVAETHFSTVLLNYYRDGKDSNGWHADNEKELGRNPIIASVSFGEERKFQLKHNINSNAKMTLNLNHGSLLLMKEGSQVHYKHQIPKASQSKKARVNLTFRMIL